VRALVAVVVIVLGALLAWPVAAADVHGVPVPRRARVATDGSFVSPLGFRATLDWYEGMFRRRREAVTVDGPHRVRDVVYVRILPGSTSSRWSAVHIFLAAGKVSVYILAASTGSAPKEAENQIIPAR
jgi:hypothetical protein